MKLTCSFGWELRPKAPYDFALTVRKPARWSLFTEFERFEGSTIWTATYLRGRLAGVKLSSRGRAIAARVFLAKTSSRFTRWPGRIRSCTTRSAISAACTTRRHRRSSPRRLAILLQMAPIARSNAMMSAFIGKYGAIAEFDGEKIRAWPSTKRVARLRASQLAKACSVGYRAKLIVALARQIEAGFPSVAELAAMPHEEAKKRLMDLPGIGDYSADIIDPHVSKALNLELRLQ